MKLVRRNKQCLRENKRCFRNDQGLECCCDGGRGACCFPYGSCVDDMTQEECQKQGGTWRGADTTCTPNLCPIGCCLPNNQCIDTTVADCQAQNGTLNGPFCAHSTCATHCPPATPPYNCAGCPDIIVAYGYLKVKSVVCQPNLAACAGLPEFVTCEGEASAPMQRINCSWELLQAQGIMTCDACQPPNPITPRLNLSASVRCNATGPAWPNPNFVVQGHVSSAGTTFVNCHPQNVAQCAHVCKGCELTGGPPAINNVIAYFPPICPPPSAGSSSSHSWSGFNCFCQGFNCGCPGSGTCFWEGSVQVG